MKVHWTDWAFVTMLIGAGCAAIYAGLSRALRYAVSERQRETERQINAMATTVKALQGRVAELSRQQMEHTEQSETGESAIQKDAALTTGEKESMNPETLATLTAAATAFLGKRARIRSARATAADDNATAWAQQGRVIVQTSHNLRQNG